MNRVRLKRRYKHQSNCNNPSDVLLMTANCVLMSWQQWPSPCWDDHTATESLKLGLQRAVRIIANCFQSSITRLLASPSIRSVMFVLLRNTNLMAWFMKCKCSVETQRRVKFISTLVWFPKGAVQGNVISGLWVHIFTSLLVSQFNIPVLQRTSSTISYEGRSAVNRKVETDR